MPNTSSPTYITDIVRRIVEKYRKKKYLPEEPPAPFRKKPSIVEEVLSRSKKANKPRNLLTHYEDTLLAMAELEGDNWLDRQLHSGPDREYDVPYAVKWVKKRQQEAKEWTPDPEYPSDEPPDLNDTVGDAIYGAGGWHRYFVRGTGDVIFSGFHALQKDKKKAEELGFEVW